MSDAHPERGLLQAYLDGELGPDQSREVREHLGACVRCRDRVAEHREWARTLTETARLVDVPEPEMDLPGPDEASGGSGDGAREDVVRIGPVRRSSMLRAAVLLLMLGMGAFALTSTPLRAFADDLIGHIANLFGGSGDGPRVVRVARDTTHPAAESPTSAVSIRARDGSLHVVVRTASEASPPVVRVRFRPGATAVVEAPGASFETSPGRLVINASQADTLLLELPETVPDVTVEVNGRSLIRKRGGEVTHGVPPDTANGDLLYRPGR